MNPELEAEKWTDKELARLENRINKQYKQAQQELDLKAKAYFKQYKARWDREHLAMLTTTKTQEEIKAEWIKLYGNSNGFSKWYKTANGAYGSTEAQARKAFQRWEEAQLGRGQHWLDLRDQMAQRITESAQISAGYINDVLPKVYIANNNAIATLAEQSALKQGKMGVKFDLVDENTVRELMKSASEVRPYKPVIISLDERDTIATHSKNKLQNALLQGILQGDSIDKIATRFETVTGMSRATAIRNARTAVTGAQNRGKLHRYDELSEKGCEITKMWSASSDSRTRPEHAEADMNYNDEDLAIPYNEPFEVGGEELMYPADPSGSPWNICNCRCSMRTGEIKFRSILTDDERGKVNIRFM